MKIIQIDKAVETEYEAAKILRQHPKDTVILNNVAVKLMRYFIR